jgi:peptide/nickel transport system substrate-binding protein
MSHKRLMSVLGLLVIASMVLTACGGQNVPTQPPAVTQPPVVTEAPTEAPTATAVPTEPPTTRKGGWLDEIVFSVVDSESAVTQIKAGAIDIYAGGLAAAEFPTIKDAGLSYSTSNGLYYDQLYNPAVCTDTTKLNPFSDAKIREATNWLYDRNYINQEVYAGGALVKFFPIQTNGPDYADLADTARALEAKYAYNLDKAKEVITTEMEGLGATLGSDGKWEFNGAPITLIHLIRTDSDGTRKPIGDYVSTQLEAVGFTVDRQYKLSREAGPIWLGTDPIECQWNVYTSAWSSTQIDRDERDMWQQMHLPTSVQGDMVFQANKPSEEFQKIGDDLANGLYTTAEQRRDMMVKAMSLGLEDSLQVWLIDGKNYTPYQTNVQVASDLAAGVEGAAIYPYTLRFKDQEGGSLKWGEPDLFAEPWNPIAGSNWAFDQAAIRATASGVNGLMPDPFTGLYWPLRIEKADITVLDSVPPVNKTHDWVTLTTAPEIQVPTDAWVDWDAKTQTFIEAGEGKTAKMKNVVTYPADFFDTVKWHDGSNVTMGDVVMALIMTFDRAKPDSAIYDEQAVPTFESFMSAFRGVKIVSTDPLVIEYYSDTVEPDAENNAFNTLFPSYSYGEAPWTSIAVGNRAEAAGELAWSADKAETAKVEETSFIGGPALEILAKHLGEAKTASEIPYEPTLGKYITADEAATRYGNLESFYNAHKHFWVGTGPYYLDQAFLTEKTLTLKHFDDAPDMADRWAGFSEPKLAEATIDGPGQVKIGDEAKFDVFVTFKGEPYAQADIKQVKYLLYNATGEVVKVGTADAVADGQYTVTLSAADTAALAAGSNKLEVAVIPLPVAVPTFSSVEFVTAP